jgi:inosine-uridine nucleoside N-ribohydrolase
MCGYHFPDKDIFADKNNRIDEGHAVHKMYETLVRHPTKVTVIATGAQTNVAILLLMYPDIKAHIEKIVFMGGAIGLGNTSIAAEFNIEIDPEASHVVFHSGE